MRKTKSAILEAVHETAQGLHAAGAMDQVTLREFDRLCLPAAGQARPDPIKDVRETSWASQSARATLL